MALRGANLASLAGAFSVDFEADPIRGAGIFAITGPTGAGKSTLLDAICLALFDSVPRLEGAESSTRTGRAGAAEDLHITYGDVRGLLRHGAAEAFAEVDFRGQDGRAYRARWEVKRARQRAEGKLQPQRMVLTDLSTNQVVGDKKTETLREIERRVGLNFDQFRRAVMLAQGEFDNFIKARSQDRAELLERITSTAIYSRLSRAAFQRAKQERDALSLLQARAGEQRPMAQDERAAAEGALREKDAALKSLRQETEAAEQAGRWHDEASRLRNLVESAAAQARQTSEAEAACAEARVVLVRGRMAFSMRAELETASAAVKQVCDAATALDTARADELRTGQIRDKACVVRADAASRAADAELAYAAAGPELDLANSLDTRIETTRQQLARSQTVLQAAMERERLACNDVDDRKRKLDAIEAARRHDAAWLADNPGVAVLGPRLGEVLLDLERRTQLANDATEIALSQTDWTDKAGKAKKQLERDEASIEVIEDELADVEQKLADLSARAQAFPRQTVSDRRDASQRAQAGLQAVRSARASFHRAEDARQEALTERRSQQAMRNRAATAIEQIERQLPLSVARQEEAERNAALSRDTASDAAAHLRALLRPGVPCAVCGSTNHDELLADDLLRARLAQDEARLTELRGETNGLREMRASQHATQEAAALACTLAGERADKAASEAARVQGELGHAVAQVNAEVPSTGWRCDPATLEDSDIAIQLANLAEQAAASGTALAEDDRQQIVMRKLATTRDDIRDRLEEARVGAVASGRAAEQSRVQATHEAGRLDAKRAEAASLDGRLNPLLSPVFDAWTRHTGLPAECETMVETWRGCTARLDQAILLMIAGKEALAAAQATLAGASEALAQSESALSGAEASRDALAAERLAIFGGRTVKDVRKAFETGIARARESHAETDQKYISAERTASRAGQARADAERALAGANDNLAEADLLLSGRLDAVGLEREEAVGLVARGQAWMNAEEQRLDGLRRQAQQAATVLEERRRQNDAHLDHAAPAVSAEQVIAVLAGLRPRELEAEAAFVAVSGVIQADDVTRTRRAGLEAELAARYAEAQIWRKLDDMIGSQTGDKFRRYAQSLTLDQLIGLANTHLLDLNPRYELERAGQGEASGGLMLQVIDRSMADEARGLHNLSGGERFIVSLALALGLASMSSGLGVQVESLFIDEGFGVLDAQSLGLAISVLEQLQATGRQVGVISHVEELKERIAVKVEVIPMGGGRSRVQVQTS